MQYPTPPTHAPTNQKTNGKATASLVLGITTLVIPLVGLVTGPLAIVFCSKAKKDIARTGENGGGLATAGLVTGIIGSAGYGLFIAFMVLGAIASAGTSAGS